MNHTTTEGVGTPVPGEHISLDADLVVKVLYLIIGCVGISGNSLVMSVVFSSKELRGTKTNILIANQSALDFTASVFIILTSLIRDVHKVDGHLARELFCRLWSNNLPIWSLFMSSTYNLVAISLERYTALVHPLAYAGQCSRTRIYIAMAVVWVSGIAYNTAYMVPSSAYLEEEQECTSYTEWSQIAQQIVGLLTVCVQYVVPLCIITFAYIRMFLVLRRGVFDEWSSSVSMDAQRRERMQKARRNVVVTLLTVALTFVVCWTPNQILYTMFNLGVDVDFNSTFYHFTVIAVFFNCCANPFIYALKYEQFKAVLFKSCREKKLENRVEAVDVDVERPVSVISLPDIQADFL